MSSSMDYELVRCRQSAEEGYNLANAKYSDIKNTLIDAERSLSKTDTEQNQVTRIKNTELVENQRSELQRLRNQINSIGSDLQSLRGRMKDFSIVVYGRTMAGKSTLMEILTHGNGKSIGKGSQRTTLDVRDYFWNGLKITDVPGIEAFSQDAAGRIDESKALKAAKNADLIVFLLSDDAPQAGEAEKLAQLRRLGKPVLGVINIKMKFTNLNDDMDIEDLQDRMANTSAINALINQFKQFAANHNQDWSGIKFVATHLLSAYMAQDKNPTVFRISRFSEVEDFILDKVRSDGRFLRIKNFADAIAVPMSNIILKIYEHSGNTLRESDVYFDKRKQLSEWREKFVERSQEKLNALYKKLSDELDEAIYDFSYYHCEDKDPGSKWQSRFKRLKFDEKYQELLKTFADECDRKRKELSDELATEMSHLSFNNNARVSVQLDSTTAWGKGISTALPLLALIPGVGWVGAGVLGAVGLLGNLLFDSKEEQRQQNREKLRDAITQPSYDVLNQMDSKVIDAFNEKILDEGVNGLYDLLAGYQFMLARLGESQYDMAKTLFDEFSDLNFKLIVEASNYKNIGSADTIYEIPRIPGEKMIIFAERPNLDTRVISDLLGEKVLVMKQEELPDTIIKILGCDYDCDFYPLEFSKENEETPEALAIFPKKKVDATSLKLAQQIAGVPIIAETIQPQRIAPLPNVSSSPQTKTSRGGQTQSRNDFDSDFEKIDEMIANDDETYRIKTELQTLEWRARYRRDAYLMNKVADYYQSISEYEKAFSCRNEAKNFER